MLIQLVPSASSRGQFQQATRVAARPSSKGIARPRNRSFWVFGLALVVGQILAVASAFAQDSALTYHYDNTRSGQVNNETILIPANVNSTRFGKLFSYAVDGIVVAQPLYVPNVVIPGKGTHNVVYVVTQHDSVYAFDADNPGNGSPLWRVSFINAAQGVTTVPISEQACPDTGFTEMGILGTPVIDHTSGTLYLSAKTREQSGSTLTYVHRLHALDITTGTEKFGGPMVVIPNGQSSQFNTLGQCQRPGLVLSGGTLFIAYGSNGCDLKSHGWIMAYNPTTLQQLATFNTSPNYTWGSSIWMSGGGLAADNSGNIFLVTANGPFDANTGGPDYGDTVLKLHYSNGSFTVADYFTPYDQQNMDNMDLDLGSGGVILLPDQTGAHPHELVTSGKTGTIYLLDRDDMGGFNSVNQNDNQIVQPIPGALGLFDSVPLYWNNTVYFAAHGDMVKAYSLSGGMLSWNPVAQSLKYAQVGNPTISSSGTTNGILWNIHNPATPMLSALDANTLVELYNSTQKSTRDALGMIAHFATPVIANEKVFVGTQTNLSVYGVFPYLGAVAGNHQSAAAGSTLPSALMVRAIDSQGNGVPGVPVTFTANPATGTFSNPTAITDSTGTASTTYTLPTKAGSVGITIKAAGYTTVSMAETGVPGPPAILAKISGMGQTGPAGTMLPNPLVFKLQDAYNNPLAGKAVNFTDIAPHGSFSSNPVITSSTGLATVFYNLPTSTGVTGTKITSETATFGTLSATMSDRVNAGPATSMVISSGNNQIGKANTKLKTMLTVLVTDQYGNPVPAVNVTYSDGGAGGVFSSTTFPTNSVGNAFVSYTLPPTPGVVHITATASGVPTVNFTETAQ
jgi:hypothetical protein